MTPPKLQKIMLAWLQRRWKGEEIELIQIKKDIKESMKLLAEEIAANPKSSLIGYVKSDIENLKAKEKVCKSQVTILIEAIKIAKQG